MNTAPFRLNESTAHTLEETMLVRATFGPMPVWSNRTSSPQATTARIPETWAMSSAARYSRNGRNSSIRMRVVVVSQPSERIVSNSQLTTRPTANPTSVPPMNETTNSPAASPNEKTPVTAARIENWKPTMPEASLNNDSPLSTLSWRWVSAASLPSELTATASVGPSAAPSANAAASGIAGQNVCTVNPTATMVAIAKPMASDSEIFNDLNNADLSISCASRYSRGAMNNTMNSSGSSSVSGKNGR